MNAVHRVVRLSVLSVCLSALPFLTATAQDASAAIAVVSAAKAANSGPGKVYAQIAAFFEAGDSKSALALMTEEAGELYLLDTVAILGDILLFEDLPKSDPIFGFAKEIGLNQRLYPKWYLDGEEGSKKQYAGLDAKLLSLLTKASDSNSVILKARKQLNRLDGPVFLGTPAKVDVRGRRAALEVKIPNPNEPGKSISDVYLFRRTEGQWLWNSYGDSSRRITDSAAGPALVDPGTDFVPFTSFDQSMDDNAISSAIFLRRDDLLLQDDFVWPKVDLARLPSSIDSAFPIGGSDGQRPSLNHLAHATVILAGGSQRDGEFSAGGVLISADGLVLTNYHVAIDFNSKMTALTTAGGCHRVVEFLAADKAADVALIRIEGEGFPFLEIAPKVPRAGDDLVLIHHSEERYFTYDRGYVRRHVELAKTTYMEMSGEYATGGSGCGIYNKDHQLVGLVCMIAYGSGPDLAFDLPTPGKVEEKVWQDPDYLGGDILVRHASAWVAIRGLWKK